MDVLRRLLQKKCGFKINDDVEFSLDRLFGSWVTNDAFSLEACVQRSEIHIFNNSGLPLVIPPLILIANLAEEYLLLDVCWQD